MNSIIFQGVTYHVCECSPVSQLFNKSVKLSEYLRFSYVCIMIQVPDLKKKLTVCRIQVCVIFKQTFYYLNPIAKLLAW